MITQEEIDFLIKIGFYIAFDDNLKLYHGRIKDIGEQQEWKVIPNFNNAKNATGNRNVFSIPSLSLAHLDIAKQFAITRKKSKNKISEVHRIIPINSSYFIYNTSFQASELNPTLQNNFRNIIQKMTSEPIHKMVPAHFEDRNIYLDINKALKAAYNTNNKKYISANLIESAYEKSKTRLPLISKEKFISVATKIASEVNTKFALLQNPSWIIKSLYYDKKESIVDTDGNTFPFSYEYLLSWFSLNNIIGAKTSIDSVTIKKTIDAYFIFDTEKVNTVNEVNRRNSEIANKYNSLSYLFSHLAGRKDLDNILHSPNPEEIISYFNKIPQYKKLLDSPARVWEGFSIGEHTESVLRVLQDSFADDLPDEILSLLRLAIVSHDIGKGYARAQGLDEHKYTKEINEQLLAKLKIDSKFIKLINYLTIEAQKYTTSYYIQKKDIGRTMLQSTCTMQLKQLLNRTPTSNEVEGLMEICKIIQTCDSGAYTRCGVTRDKETGLYYYNGNDRFGLSMGQEKADIRKRKQRLKN